MRFVSFLQRLGYLVFLQVLLLPWLAYSTFNVPLGLNLRFSFATFCNCFSCKYFILVGPFCFGLFVFHSAPGADFVWNEIFLFVSAVWHRSSREAGFVSEKIGWVYGPRPSALGPGFLLKNQVLVYTSGNVWLWGPILCLGRIFAGSAPTDYYQRLTLESWFTNLEQTPLNHSQQLPAPYKRLIDKIKKN